MIKAIVAICIFTITLYASQRVYSIQLLTSSNPKALEKVYEKLPKKVRDRSVIYVTDSGRYTIRYLLSSKATPLRQIAKELKVETLKTRFWVVNTDPKKAKELFLQKLRYLREKGEAEEAKDIETILKRVFPNLEFASKMRPKHTPKIKESEKREEEPKEEQKGKKPQIVKPKGIEAEKVVEKKAKERKRVDKKSEKEFVPEPWMLLNAALNQYDLQEIERLLKRYEGVLPHRDEVDALFKLQRYAKAKESAYSYMNRFGYDYYLYKQFLDLVSMDTSRAEGEVGYIDRGVLRYISSTLKYTDEISQKRYLFAGMEVLSTQGYDNNDLKSIPDNLKGVYVGYKELLERGYYKVAAGAKNYLDTFFQLSFEYFHRTNRRLENRLRLAIGDDATESSALLVAGKKDLAELESTYSIDGKTAVQMVLSLQRYKDQNGKNVGSGSGASLTLTKKLRLSYPDFTLKTYLLSNSYSLRDSAGLIESISVQKPPFFLPPSYTQAGVGFFFGYDQKYRYTRRWRPFVDLDLFYNSVTKQGYSAIFGVGGPLFRKDNLSITIGLSNDFGGTGQGYSEVSLYYFYLF